MEGVNEGKIFDPEGKQHGNWETGQSAWGNAEKYPGRSRTIPGALGHNLPAIMPD